MKLAAFDDHRVGTIERDSVFDVTDAVPGAGAAWPPMCMNSLIANWQDLGIRIAEKRRMAKPIALESVSLLAPNPCPVHVIAGDAAHLTSPTRGFGMNTGIQDSVDLALVQAPQGLTRFLRQRRNAMCRLKSSTFCSQRPKRVMSGASSWYVRTARYAGVPTPSRTMRSA